MRMEPQQRRCKPSLRPIKSTMAQMVKQTSPWKSQSRLKRHQSMVRRPLVKIRKALKSHKKRQMLIKNRRQLKLQLPKTEIERQGRKPAKSLQRKKHQRSLPSPSARPRKAKVRPKHPPRSLS